MRGICLTVSKCVLCLGLCLAAPGLLSVARAQVWDDVVYYPTAWYTPTGWSSTSAYYIPTTTRVISPTTTTLVPTYYSVPTAYYTPTAAYVETSSRPRLMDRLFGPRPTYTTSRTYFYNLTPTVYTTPVPTSYLATPVARSAPCETETVIENAPAPAPAATPTNPTAAKQAAPLTNGAATSPPRSVSSEPKSGGQSSPIQPKSGNLNEPPLDDARQQGPVLDDPTSGLEPPAGEASKAAGDAATQRTAYRPAATEMRAQLDAVAPNALHGEVVGVADGGKPVANAKVVFSDARQTFRDRIKTTDAQGRFDVVLPNGDWTVGIEDATGKVTTFGTITSAGGRFYDDTDRVISSLRLNR